MLNSLIKKVFGSQSDREFKRILPQVDEITALASQYQSLSDAELQAKTAAFRQDLQTRNADNHQRLDAVEASLRSELDPDERERRNVPMGTYKGMIREYNRRVDLYREATKLLNLERGQ